MDEKKRIMIPILQIKRLRRSHIPSVVDAVVCYPGSRLTLIPQLLAVAASNGSQLHALPSTCRGLKGATPLRVLPLLEQFISNDWVEAGDIMAKPPLPAFGASLIGHPSSQAPLRWAEAPIATTSQSNIPICPPCFPYFLPGACPESTAQPATCTPTSTTVSFQGTRPETSI